MSLQAHRVILSQHVDFLRELIIKDSIFLLGRRYWASRDAADPSFDKPPVKAIVIACNTATAYGLEDLRAALKRWELPVLTVGVVEAGASAVMEHIHVKIECVKQTADGELEDQNLKNMDI